MKNTTIHRHRFWLTWTLTVAFCCSCFGTPSLVVAKEAARPTATSSSTPTIAPDAISQTELRRHVIQLASDEFKGRNPAGEGGILAARYVAEEFKKIGLEPAGDDGKYFQPFSLSLPRFLSYLFDPAPSRHKPYATAKRFTDRGDLSRHHKITRFHDVSTSNPTTSTSNADSSPPMTEEETQEAAKKLNGWLKDRARAFFECKDYECRNVLGLLPGSDPELKDETIIVSAHYDHLGVRNGKIYNGADDNASGTATMLEIARVLKQRYDEGKGPARSILFAAWDAEEKGLCGSQHWVEHPTVPIEQIVTAINLDMIGRMRNHRVMVIGIASSSELDRIVTTQAKRANLRLRRWKKGVCSDHWSFFVAGIPCLTFSTGVHKDYHSPQDDVEWIRFANLSRIAKMSLDLVNELANREKPVKFTGEYAKSK